MLQLRCISYDLRLGLPHGIWIGDERDGDEGGDNGFGWIRWYGGVFLCGGIGWTGMR